MKYTKCFAGCALAVGLLAAATPFASAQDWRYPHQVQDQYGNQYYRQDNRNGYNSGYGYGNSYDRREELQEHIARDRAKLNEAIRCGNDAEAARQAADVARDQRELRDLQYGQNAGYYSGSTYNRGGSLRFGWR